MVCICEQKSFDKLQGQDFQVPLAKALGLQIHILWPCFEEQILGDATTEFACQLMRT